MKVLIVSGFLGAGKTTFIRELIRRSGVRPVILENEYGENDLDSRELSKVPDLKILEFMEGCVCCTMKGKFVNSVLSISAGLDPEYLVIEPTGVGKLGNILESLRKISYERIQLLTPIVVVAPSSLRDYIRQWPGIVQNQIGNAGLVVFSKVENEDAARVRDAVGLIRDMNPGVPILSGHYSGQDAAWWRSLLDIREQPPAPVAAAAGDAHVEQLTLREVRLPGPGMLAALLEAVLRGRFGRIVRAKGVVRAGGEFVRFDVADGLYAIRLEEGAPPSQCVFIGSDLAGPELVRSFGGRPAGDRAAPARRHKTVVPRGVRTPDPTF